VSGQDAEREAAVHKVALHGWTVAREIKKGYYVMHCGCGRHTATMHKTPRLRDHFRNRVAWMISQCSTKRKDGV
jgi:diacylglycerol kinase family enzyme